MAKAVIDPAQPKTLMEPALTRTDIALPRTQKKPRRSGAEVFRICSAAGTPLQLGKRKPNSSVSPKSGVL